MRFFSAQRFFVFAVLGIFSQENLHAGWLDLEAVQKALLRPNGISPADVNVFPPLAKPDPFRLSRVESTLRNPFQFEVYASEIKRRTTWNAQALPLSPDSLWPLLDVPATTDASHGGVKTTPVADSLASFDVARTLRTIQTGLREHLSPLSDAEKTFLYTQAPPLFLQNEEDTLLGAVEGEKIRLQEDAKLHHVMELAGRLHREGLVSAAAAAWQVETWLIGAARAGRMKTALEQLRKAAKNFPEFPLHVGSSGSDRHRVDKGIWIDPGGDDVYEFQPVDQPGAFLLILDLGGDDLYVSKDSLGRSSSNMGVTLLADLAGSDHYLGENFAFGASLFGYAQVFDAAGDDSYEGRCASLGFGFFGLGMIQDEAGNDTYAASLSSEGVGSTRGMGLLLDRSGDDRYLAKPTFKDDLRYTDHHIHMMQGFGTGFAPDFSGGIGVLRDGSGNDVYVADIFAQGSAYWYAMGLLLDESGDDRYQAYQYAQGAGVHIAVGALVDEAGNDQYLSKGVSQGCGHDYGFGLLDERGGNDTYLATDMSQGAGSANGLGILFDAAGADVYQSLNPNMTLGHGDMRRDRGSFGFFLDGGGIDQYPVEHGNGQAWRVFNGKTKGNGYGLDQ